jgi:branched-chain amino acid transport system ATP-binding protein
MPKLSIEDLKVTYGPIVGTDGVSLTLDAGETLALIGANGAGKSSTLKAILGMAAYPQGRITLDGADLKGLKPSQVVRRGVGYSPEGRRVFPQLSVLDNLKVGGFSRDAAELPQRIERIYGYFPRQASSRCWRSAVPSCRSRRS